ncbi:MAG: GntP family permease [Synergistaceae bacterium]|nr:GntP family permease [Synergistaceae bacterium]
MVQGSMLVVILLAAIVLMLLLISKFHFHPFVALFAVALVMGLCVGMKPMDVLNTILNGFGGTCRGIGIVILLGTIIGVMLERSGAAFTMADSVLKIVGEKHPAIAMSLIGSIVSIPVFCDSGFVILSSLNKSLSRRSGVSLGTMAIALSTGLFATHNLVPPTPGPIAAADKLGADLGLVIIWGIVAAIPAIIGGYLYACAVGPKLVLTVDEGESYEELKSKYGELPSAFKSFAPIIIPLILIGISSVVNYPSVLSKVGKGSTLHSIASFLGSPVIALTIGLILCFFLIPKLTEEITHGWIGEGVKEGANIIMITAAGGSLGAIIAASGVGDYIGAALKEFNLGLLLPFIIAAALKTAQGSSTVAIITTAGIITPMLESLGLGTAPMGPVLATLAIGCGSMVVSHANDSYFWVVSQFSGMELGTAYKAQTMATLVEGVCGLIAVYAIAAFML